jgi:predicted transcriptional regulator of viral defense system
LKAIYIEGVFKPLEEVRGAVPGKTYRVFSEDELRDLNENAESAGFSRKTHLYHVRAGNWIREHRAVYRLAQFPQQDRPDLMLWFLWSRNREDKPQGTYSHETALTLYDLSDAMPRKFHMTVPMRFRKNTPIPRALVLHRADLVPTDTETIHGVQVTSPLRTISDLLVEGRVSKDLVLQSLREGLRRGLITRSAVRQTRLPKGIRQQLLDFIKEADR